MNYRKIEGEFERSGYDQPLNNTTRVVWELPADVPGEAVAAWNVYF